MKKTWKKLALAVCISLGVLAVAFAVQPRSVAATNPLGVTLTPTSEGPTPTSPPTETPTQTMEPSPTPTETQSVSPPQDTPTPTAESEESGPKKSPTPQAAVLPGTGELPPGNPGFMIVGALAAVFLAGLSLGIGLRKGWKAIFPFSSWRSER